ncbi:hypothetical protein LTR53_007532 [Teratosphaeriaceae sp. CCFEE 6253]|nr:hypothetical protein LTR53_007532 [Teratosphaeriaceae sp. CCFEE 6253]
MAALAKRLRPAIAQDRRLRFGAYGLVDRLAGVGAVASRPRPMHMSALVVGPFGVSGQDAESAGIPVGKERQHSKHAASSAPHRLPSPIMEPLTSATLRATRSHILRNHAARFAARRPLSTLPPFPPTHSATPPRPPTSALPMPYVTETVAGGWHTSDIFSRLLKERIVCLNGEVDEIASASIVAQLLFLEAENPQKPINLYINSPGGSVTAGLAIYDTMQYIQSPVSTICLGQAASMGSLLLCGGAKGTRYCLPHSRIMVHQVSGGYHGQASDIAIHAKEILRVREQLNRIYQVHLTPKDGKTDGNGTKSLDEIARVMERDFFMSAEEAREWGIVDKVLDRRSPGSGGER